MFSNKPINKSIRDQALSAIYDTLIDKKDDKNRAKKQEKIHGI